MTLTELYVYVRDGGTIAVLLLVLVGAHRGWWYPRWYANELRERIRVLEAKLERAERLAEGGTSLANRAASLAERSTGGGRDG